LVHLLRIFKGLYIITRIFTGHLALLAAFKYPAHNTAPPA
jgi:hypothetical protein